MSTIFLKAVALIILIGIFSVLKAKANDDEKIPKKLQLKNIPACEMTFKHSVLNLKSQKEQLKIELPKVTKKSLEMEYNPEFTFYKKPLTEIFKKKDISSKK